MRRSLQMLGAVAAAALVLAIGPSTAQAQLSPTQIKCLATVAKAAGKFVKGKLKAIQKCNDKSLDDDPTNDCLPGEPAATIATLTIELNASIDGDCILLTAPEFGAMGFQGKCEDPNPLDGFTESDLKLCIDDTHENIVDGLIADEYGTTSGPLASDVLKCQKAISKNGAKLVNTKLKAVQKCRNNILSGKLIGIAPRKCAVSDSKTQAKVTKAESKAHAAILNKCTTAAQITALDVCNPDASTPTDAADCIVTGHTDAADSPSITSSANLIDYEYADPLACGDNILNIDIDPSDLSEECDGTQDGACPGFCGAPDGPFPCLCTDVPRERVVEHFNADLDNGWSGQSHDSGIVEGGGYVVDLYDCDGPGGPDTLCTVGPSCTVTRCQGGSNAGALCTADSECPGGRCAGAVCSNDLQCGPNGPCRKRRTAVGPYCNLDVQDTCTTNGDCAGLGNFCLKTYHGPPLPLSSGGVSVCVLNVFSEDVVGTKELTTGAAAVRLRQRSITFLGPSIEEPCPVCGGFCGDPPNGARNLCTTNADCGAGPQRSNAVPCVTDPICSFGPNADKECRPEFPYGGGTEFFGTTSVDCPVIANNISGAGIDILFNPVTTNTVTFKPNLPCDAPGFGFKTCVGAPNEGKTCTTNADCTPGTCNNQCFCPFGGGVVEKPNDCNAACVGGANVAQFCAVNSECPGGFCHLADCRDNHPGCVGGPNDDAPCTVDSECPGGFCNFGDPSGANEGFCTTGPTSGTCSAHPFKTCNIDTDCQGLNCTFCDTFPLETCVINNRQCFVNSGIVRAGVAHPINPTGVAAFCEAATSSQAINSTAGLPGPAAIRQPETASLTGF